MSNWNPLYPSNLDVDPLEEAAREAEWEDSMKDLKNRQQKEHISPDESDIEDNLFLQYGRDLKNPAGACAWLKMSYKYCFEI